MEDVYYLREGLKNLKNKLKPNKVSILLGARRVGKTQLIRRYLETVDVHTVLHLNGEDTSDASLLTEKTVAN